MIERTYDNKLNIRTTGIREWKDPNVPFNRCESTPYQSLNQLFKSYRIKKTDQIVDFGVGRGRVTFYLHNKFHVPVTGIEVNDLTYDEAVKNKTTYRSQAKHIRAPIKIEYGLAEHYEIKDTDNVFYFFNPFSIGIFETVIKNIIKSFTKNKRTVDVILYYPLNEYKEFLQKETPFVLLNKINVPERKDKKEKFLIYRLLEEDIADHRLVYKLVIGELTYDLVHAFCSSLDNLIRENVD